ncbi:DUF5707 domain-containing protein [Streptomyces sp. MI02-2A]|uniref:DUF5707 domain-containing protein n=1 Tax=unclassified Streptomyces TaxID=2593676 RepID=UPI0007411C90|nr:MULTISPECIES: DUF5707 domain-containing protein [unclassified Streptomyces]KUJ34925.1 hypothetical protein ADL25_38945 [Streptomyces sp. NRRL F-5122]MDX3263870.1 DUF5707 domain-containing protein [Streptomyces sp. MI02-2A]
MARRIALSVTAGVVVLGGVGAFALANTEEQPPTLAHSVAHYTAPEGDGQGTFSFTTEVTASSGLRSLKVMAWPADSSLAKMEPTAKEMAGAEPATCEPAGADTVRCTYKTGVAGAEAAASPHGAWYVAVLATAKDGTTTLDDKAAAFTVD